MSSAPSTVRSLALASDTKSLKNLLDTAAPSMAKALPKHLTIDRLLKVALVAVSKSELLQKCTQSSILQCVMTGAQLGLDCSGVLGSAFLVPFYNSKLGCYEATFIPGYRGLIDLARRSGQILSISANVVYKNDIFEFEYGLNPLLRHKPDYISDRVDDDVICAYCVAKLRDGGDFFDVMTKGELDKIRRSSKAAFDRDGNPKGPWRDHYAEMCRKTVVRRAIKYLPVSVELMEAIERDDEAYDKLDRGMIDITAVDSGSEPQTKTTALLEKLRSGSEPHTVPTPPQSEPAPDESPASETDDPQTAPETSHQAAPGGLEDSQIETPVPGNSESLAMFVCETLGIGEQDALKLIKLKLAKPYDKMRTGDRRKVVEDVLAGKWK